MKKMKKIMATLLAAIMTLAMAVTAFAADTPGTGKLTVNVKSGQTLTGQTIYLYKLFDVTESQGGQTTNYAYTINTATGYKDAIKSALGESFTGTTDEDYENAVSKLGQNDSAEVQKFANDFTTYALSKKVTATKDSGKITDADKTSYEFTGLDYGYYLVYVTGGKQIQSSLVTVDATTTTVNLKTEAPSIVKTADKATVEIGNVVTYTVTGSIPDTTGYDQYQYIIHDTLSNGLDFVNDANGTALDETATTVNVKVAFNDATDASTTTPTTAALDTDNHRKMSLDLSEWVRANQANKGKEFTVTYYAKVNANAVVTEKNSATLEYGNDSGDTTETTPSEAKTPTYPLDIKKVAHADQSLLAGAKFSLYTEEEYNKGVDNRQAIKVSGVNGSYVVDPTSESTEFVSVDSKVDGKEYNLHVNGLAAGTYYLVETQAPDGYNKLTNDVKLVITKGSDDDVNSWTITKDDNQTPETDKIIDIENSTGSLLPSTGGRGAIAFGVIAAALVLGVVVSFMRDKRKASL